MAALPMIATIASIAGTAVSALGTIAAGKNAQASANYEASQLQAKGLEEQAQAQQESEQYRRQKNLALSKLTNNAAASGFSTTDPTALAIGDEIAKYGTLQEQMAAYGGKVRRSSYDASATGARMEGRAARKGSYYQAASTILGGISSLAGKYNPPAPATSTDYYRYGRNTPKTNTSYG